MATTAIQNRALHRAVEILDGVSALARELGVPEVVVRAWLAGEPVPSGVFLRAVRVILEDDLRALEDSAVPDRKVSVL